MKRKLLSVAFWILAVALYTCNAPHARAQTTNTPDCVLPFTLNANGNSAVFDNRFAACVTWTLSYQASGTYSGVSLTFQSAPLSTSGGIGTFVTFTGTAATGINPNTSSTGAVSTFTNGTTNIAWVRVNNVVTGSGFLNGIVYGYKSGAGGGGGGGGGGCPGTTTTPCVVVGKDASGFTSTSNPVQIAGLSTFNGTVQPVATDSSGFAIPSFTPIALADGATNTIQEPASGAAPGSPSGTPIQYQVYPMMFNGVPAWDREFYCSNHAAFSGTGSSIQIVTGTSAKQVRICHLDFSESSAVQTTIQGGTGTVCATGTSTLAGPYPANTVLTFAMDYSSRSPLWDKTNADNICLAFGSSITVGGVVIYAVF